MSAQLRWRLVGAISVATAAALTTSLASTPAAANVPPEGAPAAVSVSTPRTAGALRIYVPSSGDTLWRISARFCGRGSLYPRLAAASGIVNSDRIYAGRTRVVLACAGATQKVSGATTPPVLKTGWTVPLPGALRCVSGWGAHRPGHTHKGVDLPKPSGTPIRAIHAGRVLVSRWGKGAGYYALITHGAYQTVYMHMNRRPVVGVGASVRAGQVIGYVGSTGHSTGPHLHLEVHHGIWHPINPAPFLRAHGIPIRGC